MHGPGELVKRDRFSLQIGTMAEEDRCIYVNSRVHFTNERVISGDVHASFYHEIFDTTLVGKNNGM